MRSFFNRKKHRQYFFNFLVKPKQGIKIGPLVSGSEIQSRALNLRKTSFHTKNRNDGTLNPIKEFSLEKTIPKGPSTVKVENNGAISDKSLKDSENTSKTSNAIC